MNDMKKAWKKLNKQEYRGIVDEMDGILYRMSVIDFENELICTLNLSSDFQIVKHYADGRFWGYNVYTRQDSTLLLVDTMPIKKRAKRLVRRIKKALAKRKECFELPY